MVSRRDGALMRYTVVLTGGIGSGKSVASAQFAALGVSVIDADVVSRALVKPGSSALQQIITAFGPNYLTPSGTLDRAALRQRIFQQPVDRRTLEAILHPLIRQRIQDLRALAKGSYVMLVIPLWHQNPDDYPADRVLLIDVPPAVQIARVQQRDQANPADVEQIMRSQSSREALQAAADDIILNVGTLAELQQAVREQHARYLASA